MKELLEALEAATNVSAVKYDTVTKEWTISYKNNLPEDTMKSKYLIEWLENG